MTNVLHGYGALFATPAEIDSPVEGHFFETIKRGAFAKTISERRDKVRALFQHGQDPIAGHKPLGPLRRLEEDERGLLYEVELLDDADYVRAIVPGLRAGLYGSSFKFAALRERFDPRPKRSPTNPRGIPERELLEVRLIELGPVTWPAYHGATAGLRSKGDALPIGGGRLEVVDRAVSAGKHGEPQSVRRLRDRAKSDRGAAKLVRDLEAGRAVEICWGAVGLGVRVTAPPSPRRRSSPQPDRASLFWFVEDPKLKSSLSSRLP